MNTLTQQGTLVAVSFVSMSPAGAITMSGHMLQTAVLRAESSERDAAFKFDTCMLTPEQQQRCIEMQAHGFIVVEAPPDWRYSYPPIRWQNEVIKRAMNTVHEVACRESAESHAGYDAELAATILMKINDVYPRAATLMELRYRMDNGPSDGALVTALAALSGDGYIDTAFDTKMRRLAPLQEISITKEGRRHLEAMTRRTPRSQKNYAENDASRFILTQLLNEFRQRKLTIDDLRKRYEGLPPAELKNRAVSEGISEVDFDLAMSDLDSHELVKTGPLKLYDNPPDSVITVIGFYSKNEYSYLTEEGYKEATRAQSRNVPTVHRSSSIIHGDQYINYGQAGAIGPQSVGTINFQQQWAAIQYQVDLNALTAELEQLRKHLQQSASSSSDYQRLALLSEAEEHAKKKDGGKAMEVLSKVGQGVLSAAKDIGTQIAATVITKAMGLQP